MRILVFYKVSYLWMNTKAMDLEDSILIGHANDGQQLRWGRATHAETL